MIFERTAVVATAEDFERSSGLAAKAMERMLSDGLAPTPENFTLWYVYFSGNNPDLTRAVDVARRDGLAVSQTLCDELYKRFFTTDAEAQAIGEAPRVARKQVGIVQCRFIGGDFAFQPLDFLRQAVEIALVLVGKLPCRRLPRRFL